ncbi:MAG: DUF4091 domain-containing protein, partial [Oscillospiraceae bacterium]
MNIQYLLSHEGIRWKKSQHLSSLMPLKADNFVTAQNDWVAMLLLFEADDDFVLKANENAAFSPYGALETLRVSVNVNGFSENCASVQIVDYMQDDDLSEVPDVLLSCPTKKATGNTIAALWIEIPVSPQQTPCIHNGTICIYRQNMFDDEYIEGEIPFTIDVKSTVLADNSSGKFHLDLWQHNCNIARKHEVAPYSDEHFAILHEYVKSLAALGQKAITIILSEAPWAGQRCFNNKAYPSDMFEYNMAKITKTKAEGFIYDFSIVKRYIELCMNSGICEEIEVFGLISCWEDKGSAFAPIIPGYSDAIRLRYFDDQDKSYKYITKREDLESYIKAIVCFFEENNYLSKVRIAADEPASEDGYLESIALIRNICPEIQFKAAINSIQFIKKSENLIADFIPMLPIITAKWEEIQSLRKEISGKLCYYVCCYPPYPNSFLASPAAECRLLPILASFLNLDGFLRWNYTIWPETPREKLSYNYKMWRAGDTNFVYPSYGGKPLLSLRYKLLKRGVEDYGLLEMVKERYGEQSPEMKGLWQNIFRDNVLSSPQNFYSPGVENYSLLDGMEMYLEKYESTVKERWPEVCSAKLTDSSIIKAEDTYTSDYLAYVKLKEDA